MFRSARAIIAEDFGTRLHAYAEFFRKAVQRHGRQTEMLQPLIAKSDIGGGFRQYRIGEPWPTGSEQGQECTDKSTACIHIVKLKKNISRFGISVAAIRLDDISLNIVKIHKVCAHAGSAIKESSVPGATLVLPGRWVWCAQ